jgi:Transposase DDE domain group 1
MDQGGQRRDQVDATVVPNVRRQRVRLQLHALAYNLGNFLRTLATPEPIKDWSLTSLKDKLIKIGAKVVSHGRYVIFQMAEVAIARQMFQEILQLIAELRPQPPPALV